MKPSNLDCLAMLVMIPWEFAPMPCKLLKILVANICIGGMACFAIPLDATPAPCRLLEFASVGIGSFILGRS